MKKWIQILLSVYLFLFLVPSVSAQENKIESIHIDVELHEDGSATIQETRQMETNEHTEIYIVLDNLNDTELLDFEVEGFTEEPDWNIEDSFEEKANKYGVIEMSDGYELAWGITEYGNPEYNVRYSLSNLVRNLEDGQALFWNFDSFLSLPTDRMTLEVSAPFLQDEDILDFYTFGFEGPFELNNGVLEWTGYGLDENNDVIVLMQFPENTFQTTATTDMTLAEQREMATEGSSYNEEAPMPLWGKVLIGSAVALGGATAIGGGVIGYKTMQIKKEHNHFYPSEYIKENRKNISQNPPQLDGDLGKYSFFISQTVPGGGGFSNYFMTYLLIWSLEDRITIQTEAADNSWFGSKVEADLFIQNFEEERAINQLTFSEYVDLFEIGESTLEEVFWTMLLETADAKGQVSGDEIQDWSEDNGSDVSDLVKLMEEVSEEWLIENGYLKKYTTQGIVGQLEIKELTKKGDEFVTNLVKFNNFIKEIDEVSLQDFDEWHELIVWAAVFGQAEKTVEHLEEFHPETWTYLVDQYPYVYGNYYGYHYFYTSNTTGLASGGYGGAAGGGMSSAGGGAGAGGGGGGGSR